VDCGVQAGCGGRGGGWWASRSVDDAPKEVCLGASQKTDAELEGWSGGKLRTRRGRESEFRGRSQWLERLGEKWKSRQMMVVVQREERGGGIRGGKSGERVKGIVLEDMQTPEEAGSTTCVLTKQYF